MNENLENLENLKISSLKKDFRNLFRGVFEVHDPATVNENLRKIRQVYQKKVNPEQ